MKVPMQDRQVKENVGNVPTPPSVQPMRSAFGENIVQAQGTLSETADVMSNVLAKQAERKQKEQDSKFLLNLDKQYTLHNQDLLWNKDEEETTIDGQIIQRPKGIMNRSGDLTEGSIYEYDKKSKDFMDSWLVATPKHLKQEATKYLTNTYLSNRNSVIGHEVQQKKKATDLQFTSSIESTKDSLYMAQDPGALLRKSENLKGQVNSYMDWLGITDKETRTIILDKHLSEGIEKSIEGALELDMSGVRARGLVQSALDSKVVSKEDYDLMSKKIDLQVKQNSRLVEDDLLSQFIMETLTPGEVMSAASPQEKGGIGASKANTLINKLISAQKAKVKDISKDDEAATEYIALVDSMLNNRIDQFEAKQLLVDAKANGMPKEDVEKLRKVKSLLSDMKWNTEHAVWNNSMDTLMSWFGKERSPDNKALAVAIKTLISSDKNPEEVTQEIIRNDYNSKNPDTQIPPDGNVLQEIENNENKLKDKASQIMSQISEFLVPSAEAAETNETNETDDMSKPIEKETKVPKKKDLSTQLKEDLQFQVDQARAFSIGVISRAQESVYESFESFVNQSEMRSTLMNEAMDIISGGMSLEQAEALRDKEIERVKKIPGNLSALAKETIQFSAEKMVNDLRVASDFLHDPIGTLMSTKDDKLEMKGYSPKAKQGALDIVHFLFDPFVKSARGIGGLVFPEEGDILGKQGSIKDRLQQSVKDMLDDPGAGYIAERIGDDIFTGHESDSSRALKIFTAAAAGTVSEVLTFNPKLIWNALKSLRPSYQTSLRQKEILRAMEDDLPKLREYAKARMKAKGYPESTTNQIVPQLEAIHFARGAEYDINLGNYLKGVIDRTIPRFGGLKALANQRGEMSFIGESGIPLKSNLQAVIGSVKMPAFTTATQALNTLKNAGLTKDEIEFSGIEKFLEGKDKVSQKELMEFVEKNKVKLNVIKTNEPSTYPKTSPEKLEADENVQRLESLFGFKVKVNDNLGLISFENNETGELLTWEEVEKINEEAGELAADIETAVRTGDFQNSVAGGRETVPADALEEGDKILLSDNTYGIVDSIDAQKREVYVMFEDGREVVFPVEDGQAELAVLAKDGDSQLAPLPEGSDLGQLMDRGDPTVLLEPALPSDFGDQPLPKYSGYQLPGGKNYKEIKIQYLEPGNKLDSYVSPHWSERNVLAHLRTNERVDMEGNSVLFLEELQPEWIKAARGKVEASDRPPFSKEWVLLGVKQAIQEAIETGKDSVAWINGQQTADRYDLSKHLSHIQYEKLETGNYNVTAFGTSGGTVWNGTQVNLKDLETHLGKDIVDKINKGLGKSDGKRVKRIEGLDLKIGGEWAKELYDKILPNTVNRYVKKWGSKVEEIELPLTNVPMSTEGMSPAEAKGWLEASRKDVNKQQGFKITPQMVKEVTEEGQPMFGQRLASATPAERLKSQRGQAAGSENLPDTPEGEGVKPEILRELESKSTEVPQFKTTEEAVAFGEKATSAQKQELLKRREEILKQNKELMSKPNKTDEEFQLGMDKSVEAQFYREALEAASGSLSLNRLQNIRGQLNLGSGGSKKSTKALVRETTGQVKPQGKSISEKQALKRALQREQKGTRKAESEGVKFGIEKGQQKVKDVLLPTLAKERLKYQQELTELERREQLGLLKEDIKSRNKLNQLRLRDKLRKEKAKMKKDLSKKIKEIKEPPAKTLPIEYKDAITEIQKNIDTGKLKLTNILKVTEELGLDAELVDTMKNVNGLSATDMTIDELNDVHDVIQQLRYSGSIANKFLKVNTDKSIQETILEGAKTITKGKGLSDIPPISKHLKKEWDKKPQDFKNKYIAEHRRPEAVFEQLDGWQEGISYNTAFKPMIKAEQQYQKSMGDRVEELSAIVDDVNIARAINKTENVPGFDVPLTRDNMYFILANSLNTQNRAHLMASGVSEEMIENVIEKLSPEEVQMVNDVLLFLKDQWNSLDQTYSALRGKHMGKINDFYFPIMNLEKVGNLEAIEMNVKMFGDFIRAGVPKGFTKERSPMSEKAFKRYSFFENVHRYVRQAEYYKAFALPIRDASRYLRNPNIKQAISENLNPQTYTVLNNWLDDIARGRDKTTGEFLDDLSALIRTNFVTSVLGANLSTVTKQFPSFVQGTGMIGESWGMSGLSQFLKDPNGTIDFVNTKSVQMKNRRYSQERELQEIAEGRGIEKILGGKTKLSDLNLKQLKQMIKEEAMLPILLADRATVTAIWKGAYDKKMEQTLGNEELAIEYADKVIRRTQPQSGLVHLPSIFKSTPLMKLPTTFKNQPNQNWNLIYDTYVKYNEGAKTKETFGEFMKGTFYYLIFGGILFGAISRRRLPKDFKELSIDILHQGVGGLVGLSQLVAKIKYPWGSTDLLDATMSDAAKIATSKEIMTKAKYAGRTLGKVVGIPGYTAVERFITRESLSTKLLGGEKETKKKNRSF